MAIGFRIAARALRQLGAELITSDAVALNELIKNAFDAGSPRVSVSIKAPIDASVLDLVLEQLISENYSIKDSLAKIQKNFSPELEIQAKSDILKEFQDHAGSKEDLAEYIKTYRNSKFSIKISDTGIGMSHGDLIDRFLVIGTPNKMLAKKNGQLNLLGEKGVGRLSMMRLGNSARVKSKQEGSTHWNQIIFKWDKFDDPNLFLDEVDVEVEGANEDSTDVHGTIINVRQLFEHWNAAKVEGFISKYVRRFQDPFATTVKPYPIDIYLNDARQPIRAMQPWLEKCAQFKAKIEFNPDGLDGSDQVLRRSLTWRDSTSSEIRSWSLHDLAQQLTIPEEIFKNLGALEANCLWFNRQMINARSIDRSLGEVKAELNIWCGGFSIYRDGFRIGLTGGMDDDWLEWDSKSLRSQGFTLNRYQTIGSINISSNLNKFLIDAANRERLISCPEQQLLKLIFGIVITDDFRMHINTTRELEGKKNIEEESAEDSLQRSEELLVKSIANIEEISKELNPEHKAKLGVIRTDLQNQVEYIKTLNNALQMSQETRVELLELANIGLVVEIVIHELTRLTERTGELLIELKDTGEGKSVVNIIDNLQSQIKATNKRIRTVDVMSPAGRHHKESYDAIKQTISIADGFSNRFKRHDITSEVTVNGNPPNGKLEIYMVKGLIAQVLENLITNSVYWLLQGLKPGETQRKITFDIDTEAKTLSISDNGPGVEPKYAKDIFKPYYTTRRKGKGLGLFIANELVEYHGGKLYLDTYPEEDGRLRTFILELPRELPHG